MCGTNLEFDDLKKKKKKGPFQQLVCSSTVKRTITTAVVPYTPSPNMHAVLCCLCDNGDPSSIFLDIQVSALLYPESNVSQYIPRRYPQLLPAIAHPICAHPYVRTLPVSNQAGCPGYASFLEVQFRGATDMTEVPTVSRY